jgi:hypothetical protein
MRRAISVIALFALAAIISGCGLDARTTPATNVTTTSATVNASGMRLAHHWGIWIFQYGELATGQTEPASWIQPATGGGVFGNFGAPNCDPGDQTPPDVPANFTDTLSGLQPGTRYAYRLRVEHCMGPNPSETRFYDSAAQVPAGAAGNWSTFITKLQAPSLPDLDPLSGANHNNPRVFGTAPASTTVNLYTNSQCTGAPVASGTPAQYAQGLTVHVPDDSTTEFWANASNSVTSSDCVGPTEYVENTANGVSTPPAWTVRYDHDNAPATDPLVLSALQVSGHGSVSLVAYYSDETELRAIDQDGNEIWTQPVADTSDLTSGFDYNVDGWPDVMLVGKVGTSWGTCNTSDGPQDLFDREVRIWNGATGGEPDVPLPQLPDFCGVDQDHPGSNSMIPRWSTRQPFFGPSHSITRHLAFAPYRYDDGWIVRWNAGSGQFTQWSFKQPHAAGGYSNFYPAVDQSGAPTDPSASPLMNGLVVPLAQGAANEIGVMYTFTGGMHIGGGEPRGPRAAIYVVDVPLRPQQLFLETVEGFECKQPGEPTIWRCETNRPSYRGRTNGLVVDDPGSNIVSLFTGANAYSMFHDIGTGFLPPDSGDDYDRWGGMDRRVTAWAPNEYVSDWFFSSAADGTMGAGGFVGPANSFAYSNRIVYPANTTVELGRRTNARWAYNVYNPNQTWTLRVTFRGGMANHRLYENRFLWDIRDIDGDKTDEWITSPATVPAANGTRYQVEKKIEIFTWDEAQDQLVPERTINDAYPYLQPHYRSGRVSTTDEALFPILTASTPSGPKLWIMKNNGSGQFVGPVLEP